MKKLTKRSLTSEMERNVRQMLKLIEEEGDSFAQKAEMYYQKRPELISLVEEFYRGYRSLAERYEHVTGELSKNTPSDLQSQTSDGSEPASTLHSPSRKLPRRVSTNRAAGFDFFLGSGGNDACQKDGDGSSTLTDSDDEYDDTSSINSFSGFFVNGNDPNIINRRVLELEIELRGMKEKYGNMNEEERVVEDSLSRGTRIENKAEEIRNLNEKLRLYEGEVSKLRIEAERYRSTESGNLKGGVELSSIEEEIKMRGDAMDLKTLEEELRLTKEKLESSEVQIASLRLEVNNNKSCVQQLQDQLDLAQKDIANWKSRFNSEKRDRTVVQERLAKMKTNLSDRDHEVRNLKAALSDAEQKIFFERAHLKSEMSKLLGEQTQLEENIREWECQCQSLEEKVRKIQSEKIGKGETLLKGEIEKLKKDIEEKKKKIKDLNLSLDALRLEKANLNGQVSSLKELINSKDIEIEEAHKQGEELTSRINQLEEETKRQRVEILEGAEEKREAIRQLCFSIEHYRSEYIELRQAVMGT
ncbi:hypothetical protein VNO77_43461 [Canavalia gladiata]|uniref:NAB domain-containing protein n=1 Tax=Canavalia gladiata TaxID=3824 RepID=A0AAN9PMX9_CANGL